MESGEKRKRAIPELGQTAIPSAFVFPFLPFPLTPY